MKTSLFDAPYHPLRAVLMLRLSYLLLAGDCWLGMVQHGGRYGLGGFNVAHFALLDALLPVPSAGTYVGLMVFSGFVALWMSAFSSPRWLRLLLVFSYSAAWMISIHDSYQHHYFLSWLLLWCAALPEISLVTLHQRLDPDDRVRSWGLPMTAITCAIVYTFTGISKSEPAWRSGDVLRAITRVGADWGQLEPVRNVLFQLGLDAQLLWRLLAYATIGLQWVIALGYLLAPRRDAEPSRWRSAVVTVALIGAWMFHVTTELSGGFEIGLFSYYMIAIATALLAPVVMLMPLGLTLSRAAQRVDGLLARTEARLSWPRLLVLLFLVLAIAAVVPLPGMWGAMSAAAAVVTIMTVQAPARGAQIGLQTTFCAVCTWLALTQSSVPFDFYRRTAGELRRMDMLEQALEAYRMADRYAPAGNTRAKTIGELERELAARERRRSEHGGQRDRELVVEPQQR